MTLSARRATAVLIVLLAAPSPRAQQIIGQPQPPPLPTSIAAWGWDDLGRLGNGLPMMDRNSPAAVTLVDPTAIGAGAAHSLALKANGTVWTWGDNSHMQLGGASNASCGWVNGTLEWCPSPARVGSLSGVRAIAAGYLHNLALKGDHTVWAWGSNAGGALGDPNIALWSAQPVQVPGLITGTYPSPSYTYPTTIAAGSSFGLTRRTDGKLLAWGRGTFGELGNGMFQSSAMPVQVVGANGSGALTQIVAIATGQSHALAVTSFGTVFAWGRGGNGRLGNNAASDSAIPVQVLVSTPTGAFNLGDVVAVAGGGSHSLALKRDGTVWAWGDNSMGQLGDNGVVAERSTAGQVIIGVIHDFLGDRAVPLTNVVAIAAGENHSLAIKSDGTLWAWGKNGVIFPLPRLGMLGTGNTTDGAIFVATPVPGLSGVLAASGGQTHSLALTCSTFSTGRQYCYGLQSMPPSPF